MFRAETFDAMPSTIQITCNQGSMEMQTETSFRFYYLDISVVSNQYDKQDDGFQLRNDRDKVYHNGGIENVE